jgi:hypothetical protein
MVRRTVGVLAIAAAAIALVASVSAQDRDNNKAKPQDDKPADRIELTAKIVKVDLAKSIITVDDAGTQRDFTVTKATKIVGPRGAANKERLGDERFAPGWEMKLTISADGKKLLQIQLPLRKNKKADKE